MKKLALSKRHGSKFLENAALGIVICADGEKSDVWIEDCSIASILVQMVAQSMGLGSCWIQIRKRMFDDQMSSEEYIRKLLNVPNHMHLESIIAIGYPAKTREPIPRQKLTDDKIRFNCF